MAEQVRFLQPVEVQKKIDEGAAYVVDVREPDEYAQAHIAGVELLPLSQFEPSAVAPPPGKMLIIHCRSGRRCGLAAEQLIAAGYKGDIYRMVGGLLAWTEAGLPVKTGADT